MTLDEYRQKRVVWWAIRRAKSQVESAREQLSARCEEQIRGLAQTREGLDKNGCMNVSVVSAGVDIVRLYGVLDQAKASYDMVKGLWGSLFGEVYDEDKVSAQIEEADNELFGKEKQAGAERR
jgi:hypothetical protein